MSTAKDETLLKEIDKALEALHESEEKLEEQKDYITKRILLAKFGVEQGSIITTKDGSEFKVVDVETRWGPDRRPWLQVCKRKKDRTFSTAVRTIYQSWELKST